MRVVLKFGDLESIRLRDQGRAMAILPDLQCPFCRSRKIGWLKPPGGIIGESIEWSCLRCSALFETDLEGKRKGAPAEDEWDEDDYLDYMIDFMGEP